MRDFYVDDVSGISKHWHDLGSDPGERSPAPIYFVWWFAHDVDGHHGGPCAERAYEALGVSGLIKAQKVPHLARG